MLLTGEEKKICTLAAQKNGEVHGAECFVLENSLIVWKSELKGRKWLFKVSYNEGIKIEDNEGNQRTFEEKPKSNKKSTPVGKDNADDAVV